MEWQIILKSNRSIQKDEVQNIIDYLPEEFSRFSGSNTNNKKSWGWSAKADIYYPNFNHLMISGVYGLSSNIAVPMANYFKNKLEEQGHMIIIDYQW